MTLRTFMCDVTYIPQTASQPGGIKRSKHDYCNKFNNETIIKFLYEFTNSYKVLIHHGILNLFLMFLIYTEH